MSIRAARAALVAGLAASPFVMHAALFHPRLVPLAGIAAGLQGYAAGVALPVAHSSWAALAVAAALAIAVMAEPGISLLAWPGILHALIYSALLFYFMSSLGQGHDPAISRLAREIRGPLSPKIERYTRHVTLAWCCFFAGQLALSGWLLAIMPQSQWLWFVTLFNLPLVGLMFAAEYAVRCVVLGHEAHDNLSDMVRAVAALRKGSAP